MIKTKYSFEHYINPYLTHSIISDKVKIGQLILNLKNKKIQKIDLETLSEIIKAEKSESLSEYYSLLPINSTWLTNFFHFESRYLAAQYMTVYTSQTHGLKIHEQNSRFSIGYIIREKLNDKGKVQTKPLIFTVNDLMDHLYLLKREELLINQKDIELMNKEFQVQLEKL